MPLLLPTTAFQKERADQIVRFDWYAQENYPRYIQELLYRPHLKHFSAFKLFQFFMMNGMNPIFVEAICKPVMDETKLKDLFKSWKSGRIFRYPYFDLLLNKVVTSAKYVDRIFGLYD